VEDRWRDGPGFPLFVANLDGNFKTKTVLES